MAPVCTPYHWRSSVKPKVAMTMYFSLLFKPSRSDETLSMHTTIKRIWQIKFSFSINWEIKWLKITIKMIPRSFHQVGKRRIAYRLSTSWTVFPPIKPFIFLQYGVVELDIFIWYALATKKLEHTPILNYLQGFVRWP